MKHTIATAIALLCYSAAAQATVTTFTDPTSFHAANPDAVLIEDFENSYSGIRDMHLPSYLGPTGLIGFLPLTSSYPFEPNVVLASPGYINFGAGLTPTTSVILTGSGNQDFVGLMQVPVTSLGFDLFLNDSPGTLSFFNGDALLATLTYDSPVVFGQNLAFAGIYSSEGVTSFRWTASDGQYLDTGVDNIFAGPIPSLSIAAVPEPSTWALMLSGFGAIGLFMRRRRKADSILAIG